MTLPLFLALHLLYGTLVARVMFPRMRAEGEVLGPPLLIMLVPVAFVSAPIGTIFMRYSGGWFLHGLLLGEGSVAYERFHFGLLLAVIAGIAICTIGSIVNVAVWASRGRSQMANAGLWLGGAIAIATVGVDVKNIITIVGTGGRHLWVHPVGLLSLIAVVVLFGWIAVIKTRFAAPPPQTGPGTSVPLSPLSGPWT